MARVEPVDAQRRRSLGAVFRSERHEQRDRDLPDGELRAGHQEPGVPEGAGGAALSRRRGFPARSDGAGYPVVQSRAAPRSGLGRPRRRPSRRPFVLRGGVRFHVGRVPQHQFVRTAVRQPLDSDRSAGADGRSLSRGRRRSASDRHECRHRVRAVRQLRRHGSGHQLAARPVVERHRGATDRFTVGRERRLPRQPLGPAVGADRAESRPLHGPRPVHAQERRHLSGVLRQRQPQFPAGALPAESHRGGVHWRVGSAY